MRTYSCVCGSPLFFDNSLCLACNRELGYCPACRMLTAILPGEGAYACGACSTRLVKCSNYAEHGVCNRCVASEDAVGPELCDVCRFNHTIPDLSIEGNLRKWYHLESAKRRLFYDLSQLGLPYGTAADGIKPSLAFDFKADALPDGEGWRTLNEHERVFTGHANGLITINISEADTVERERARVDMGESKRTLLGHFRHEIGHFYWDLLVKQRREEECKKVFGDHENPAYSVAMENYYANGPAADWAQRCITPYASMHPWEDFAETWATYLAMVSELDTAHHMGIGGVADPANADVKKMINRYRRLGIALNEMNRSMGLLDIVPEVIVQPVVDKLQFIHELVLQGRAENGALQGEAAHEAATT